MGQHLGTVISTRGGEVCGGDSDGRAPAVSGTAEQGAVFRIKGDPQDMPPAGQQTISPERAAEVAGYPCPWIDRRSNYSDSPSVCRQFGC